MSSPNSEWTSIHERDPILHQAAYVGDLEKLRSLLRNKGERKGLNAKNRLGCSPLRLAATGGHTGCVKYLISEGAEVNMTDVKAQTPLFVSVKNKHMSCARALLEAGASPDGSTNSLCTPLYIAAMDGCHQGVQELVKHGADIDRCQMTMGFFQSTPLYISLAYHHLDCFRTLLLAGADPDATADKRKVPSFQSLYHSTVTHNVDEQFVLLLFDFGASLYIRDSKGKLAADLDQDNDCKTRLKALMTHPRGLMSGCRIGIRNKVGRRRLHLLPQLPLPSQLKRYLTHGTESAMDQTDPLHT